MPKYTIEDDPKYTIKDKATPLRPVSGPYVGTMTAGGPPAPDRRVGLPFSDNLRLHAEKFLRENAPTIWAGIGSLAAPGLGSAIGLAAAGGFAGAEAQGKTGEEAAIEGGKQAAYEFGGRVIGFFTGRIAGRVLERYPELASVLKLDKIAGGASPKAVQHLTAAASGKGQAGQALEPIAATIGDIEQQMEKLPPQKRTVGDFLNAVTVARKEIHDEYGNALGPYANKEISTHSIADSIRELKKPWMDVGEEGAAERAAIDAAATSFERPRTVGQLDSLREQLNTDLSSLYGKTPNARYTALHGNINTAIDDTIRRGARNILYPVADKAASKPSGYFADALDRESNLIQLRGILQQRIKSLSGAQSVSEVASPFSSENISLSAHAGSLPRAGVYGLKNMFAPPRELNQASKHVAKAFPVDVDTLPYQALFSNAIRAAESPAVQGPNTRKLQELRNANSSAPQ